MFNIAIVVNRSAIIDKTRDLGSLRLGRGPCQGRAQQVAKKVLLQLGAAAAAAVAVAALPVLQTSSLSDSDYGGTVVPRLQISPVLDP